MPPLSRSLAVSLLGGTLLLGACTKPAASSSTSSSTSTEVKSTTVSNDLDAAPPKRSALNIRVVTPKRGSLKVSRSSSATLKAARDSQVAALTGGAVTAVLAQEGQQVQAGQVVVQLDDSALRQTLESARLQLQNAQINLAQTQRNTAQGDPQLKAAVAAAQANYDKAVQDVAANRNLYALGGISAADLKSSEATLAQTQSALAQAKNNLTQNGQSGAGSLALLENQVQSAQVSVKQAQENLAKASVRAPFSGTVATISAKLGEYVNTGSAVFRLVDTSSLSADFRVSPTDAARLSAGTKLNFDYGGKTYLAEIKEGDRVAGSDRLVPLSTRLYGAQNLPVGGVGQMRYRVDLGEGLLLPTGAIENDGGGNAVYVVKDGAASKVPVQVVAESQGQVALSGLPASAQVIYPVPPSLQDGAGVQVGGS
ncbi:efflux transporter periplasmic adaptor subunit [Deinococcus irradiatisoli]|uniref:Efflux transporter periplasmic adaptor subunit n=1 Tax=Deinococcus irradiatisoli TaxID=2202254 RepID=A0A2Z3JDZ0_9DEIO|nr:efflux RND transporter periplasmic adaptor subunit [Deinococcus irradiatisoli]AWN23393.1 efflux transporter periplasmic adaptor subunit [Deinococcus irradiatisoli]